MLEKLVVGTFGGSFSGNIHEVLSFGKSVWDIQLS